MASKLFEILGKMVFVMVVLIILIAILGSGGLLLIPIAAIAGVLFLGIAIGKRLKK